MTTVPFPAGDAWRVRDRLVVRKPVVPANDTKTNDMSFIVEDLEAFGAVGSWEARDNVDFTESAHVTVSEDDVAALDEMLISLRVIEPANDRPHTVEIGAAICCTTAEQHWLGPTAWRDTVSGTGVASHGRGDHRFWHEIVVVVLAVFRERKGDVVSHFQTLRVMDTVLVTWWFYANGEGEGWKGRVGALDLLMEKKGV
uniref:Uncharacterized protein n=1 Tax=Salix viminalis TaxID=40686 RepID=A0A6N2KLM4_SALVM